MTDTVLVLAWLVLAHLIADFVLQNDWIAINKATGGRLGWAALNVHGFHVGLCLVPAALAWGWRGGPGWGTGVGIAGPAYVYPPPACSVTFEMAAGRVAGFTRRGDGCLAVPA